MQNILYDPYLVEEVVFSEVRTKEGGDDSNLYEEYHRLRNEIYELDDEEEQSDQFIELNKNFFKKLGLSEAVRGVVEEFPDLKEKIEDIHVRKALSPVEVGADLVDKKRKLLVKVFPEQYFDIPCLKRVLRHEFLHTTDVLDEKFGYNDDSFAHLPKTEENILIVRLRLFWDIFIDSRLERWGKETVQTKSERFEEFEKHYAKIPTEKRKIVFEGLWMDEELTYEKIVDVAKDPYKLLTFYGATELGDAEDEQKKILLPGTPCPLCKFPTYTWVDTSETDEKIIDSLKEDFPDWQHEDGICDRCIECYSVRAGFWLTPKKA
ncbi:MAG: hypothetical protein ACUZ77_01005 [Candidatus Brocadiales bacterium]